MSAFMEMNQLTKYVCYIYIYIFKGFVIVLGRLPQYMTYYRTGIVIGMIELEPNYVLQYCNTLLLLT